ncbi:unnamed protein product [Lactuca virosa]|uniref:Uncharacterized protein n=1 Tax=Lactuca virosa TaxID=75947 RepID=A0AAU9NWT4_9ASTR|nr:unnamed protein product [Lactuca virosa]
MDVSRIESIQGMDFFSGKTSPTFEALILHRSLTSLPRSKLKLRSVISISLRLIHGSRSCPNCPGIPGVALAAVVKEFRRDPPLTTTTTTPPSPPLP